MKYLKPSEFAREYLGVEVLKHQREFVDDVEGTNLLYRAGRKTGRKTSMAIKILHRAIYAKYVSSMMDVDKYFEIRCFQPTARTAEMFMDLLRKLCNKKLGGFIEMKSKYEMYVTWMNGMGRTLIEVKVFRDGETRGKIEPHVYAIPNAEFFDGNVLMNMVLSHRSEVWFSCTTRGNPLFLHECSKDAKGKSPTWHEYTASGLLMFDADVPMSRFEGVSVEMFRQDILAEWTD